MKSYIKDLIKSVEILQRKVDALEKSTISTPTWLGNLDFAVRNLEEKVEDLTIDKWAQKESKEFLDYKLVTKSPPSWIGSSYEADIHPLKEEGYFLKCTYEHDPHIELWVKKA